MILIQDPAAMPDSDRRQNGFSKQLLEPFCFQFQTNSSTTAENAKDSQKERDFLPLSWPASWDLYMRMLARLSLSSVLSQSCSCIGTHGILSLFSESWWLEWWHYLSKSPVMPFGPMKSLDESGKSSDRWCEQFRSSELFIVGSLEQFVLPM